MRNVARTIWLKRVQQTTITGTTANTMSVSHTFMPARMMNEITPFSPAMKNSSGQWWANSVTSNRSLVMRPMIWPTLVLAK